ncbi:hypothetical protein K7432_014499 [Basidiobolus ranarum]|uniref:Uncharacterized protein n=1 Tax=Basidiobolus ranarum TaxID=34480 RepID=A0ABR2VPK6_9FUNG
MKLSSVAMMSLMTLGAVYSQENIDSSINPNDPTSAQTTLTSTISSTTENSTTALTQTTPTSTTSSTTENSTTALTQTTFPSYVYVSLPSVDSVFGIHIPTTGGKPVATLANGDVINSVVITKTLTVSSEDVVALATASYVSRVPTPTSSSTVNLMNPLTISVLLLSVLSVMYI